MLSVVRNWMQHRALVEPNALFKVWQASNLRRIREARKHRSLFPDAARIADELSREGLVKDDAAAFLTPSGLQYLHNVRADLLEKAARPEIQRMVSSKSVGDLYANKKKPYLINLLHPGFVHSPDSDLVKLALDPKLLEVVAGHLGLCPRLDAISAILNFPTDEPPMASQMWHRDPEDIKVVKVFVYLVDVDEDTGPFSYMPRTHSFGEQAARVPAHNHPTRISDEEMSTAFTPNSHRVCTGPANTMIVADTVGLHRGGKPIAKDRLLLNLSYTSSWPGKRSLKIENSPPAWQMSNMQRMALA